MQIGPHKISIIETGDFRLDGGAMFGVVPKVLWERVCPADDSNRIAMTCRALLIESEDRKILVDAGIGSKESRKFHDLYGVDFSKNTLENSLLAHGLAPADITDVICTHLHFDHCGGLTRTENGQAVPVFFRARHHIQKRHWQHALNCTERDRASFLPPNYMPLHEAGLLNLIEGNGELFPGIHLLVANGHTPALQTVQIMDGTHALWYPADLLPMSAHIPLPYIMGYDLFPLTTLEEKRRWLPQAAHENWIVVYEHDPHCVASRIVHSDKGLVMRGDTVAI